MIRRPIKSLTIEYEDGGVETHQSEGMAHISRVNYPGGANPKAEDGFTVHAITWTGPKE